MDLGPPFTARDEATRWLFQLNRFGFRPGLGRIQGLLSDLGHPERDLSTLVVAGTNGKGSTTRILAHLLAEAGHKVAIYTSPHLLGVYERILIDDSPLSEDDFAQRVERIRPLVEKHEASWFETLTALAVEAARDGGVDWLCCETGLGGRLDATNALPAAGIVLTTVAMDHQQILGSTLEEIAREKLGLLKGRTPLFCGADAELNPLVFRSAVTAGSPCHFLDEITRITVHENGRWDLILRDRVFSDLPVVGSGAMRRNVALALLTLDELEEKSGPSLVPDNVASALGNLFLPGRYQTLLRDPNWVFDTAHNDQALDIAFRAFAGTKVEGRKFVLFGSMRDKELGSELTEALRGLDHMVGFPVSLPRARNVEELGDLFRGWGWKVEETGDAMPAEAPRCWVAQDPGEAIHAAARWMQPEDAVLVTGSCFAVAEIMYRLGYEQIDQTRTPEDAQRVLARFREG